MEFELPFTYGDVGVFWDVTSSSDVDISELGLKFLGITPYVTKKFALGHFSESNVNDQLLTDLGFELVNISSGDVSYDMSLTVLFWLWDGEKSRIRDTRPCVVVISSNPKVTQLLESVRERNVFLIVVADFQRLACFDAWSRLADAFIDLSLMVNNCEDLSSSSERSVALQNSGTTEGIYSEAKVGVNTLTLPDNDSSHGTFSISSEQSFNSFPPEAK